MRILLGLIVALFLSLSGLAQDKTTSRPLFVMMDGYIYHCGAKPLHLTHDMHNWRQYSFNRGDGFHIHMDLNLGSDVESPCSNKDEKECNLTVQFIELGPAGKETIVSSKFISIYMGPQSGFGWPDEVPRKITGESALVRVTITKGNAEYFRFDIPIKVR